MTVEIETLANARYERGDMGRAWLVVEVNGRSCEIMREKALRLDGEIAALGPWNDFQDFFVVIPPSEKHGIHSVTKLPAYTNDQRYVALVRQFVEAVDSGSFHEGPVDIPR